MLLLAVCMPRNMSDPMKVLMSGRTFHVDQDPNFSWLSNPQSHVGRKLGLNGMCLESPCGLGT